MDRADTTPLIIETGSQAELQHQATLNLPPIALEIYLSHSLSQQETPLIQTLEADIQRLWPHFWEQVSRDRDLLSDLGLNQQQAWEVELSWVDNQSIQALNAQYRHKDAATDVLSFCLFADQTEQESALFASLPVVSLGEIFVSVSWARHELAKADETLLRRYLLERVFHGFLHLMGAHHDTEKDYERVKRIQDNVLAHF